ncbi:superoxide dismutase family protein [Hyphomicrobium methylovorum]|uniref:superoxide dismutase family protein n=1 Tax=Hyphomicrobium methylovorum TaxID=84 RepID=UPI0015E670EE|nr:superoxide dismutase family protein [Hyphomicrobium methylovorum]MBA2127431.1 superoxide dismutase family protein [Hyphomicrobium methylovorum]
MRMLVLAVTALIAAAPTVAFAQSADVVGPNMAKIGKIEAKEGPHGLVLVLNLDKGALTPGAHGIHIHEHGDCSDEGFKNSKSHINPSKTEHGFLNPKGPHPSDLPNVWAHEDGSVLAEMFVPGLSLTGENAIYDEDGSAVVIHASADDHITQPIGGAGARVACGLFKK